MTYRMPNEPGRYIDVRSDYEEQRYHLRHDTQAETFNVYAVSLPPWLNEPGLLSETFEGALATLARLRSQPFAPLYPPDVWQPMGIIIATSLDAVSRDIAIRLAMLEGGADGCESLQQDPDKRVAALARALALVRGMPMPAGSMDHWDKLKVASN
jgi:hypothetical protein